nr:rho-related GTP-binding protein RhoV isoform X3 [Globicephala melas]
MATALWEHAGADCTLWKEVTMHRRDLRSGDLRSLEEHRLQTGRLSGHGSRAQPLRGMWDPPGPGHEPISPAWAGGLSATCATREAQPPVILSTTREHCGHLECKLQKNRHCVSAFIAPHLTPAWDCVLWTQPLQQRQRPAVALGYRIDLSPEVLIENQGIMKVVPSAGETRRGIEPISSFEGWMSGWQDTTIDRGTLSLQPTSGSFSALA